MPDVSGPAVAFAGVTKTYPGGVVAVRGVDLAIAGGSFVALVGTSGSGKSTLLKTVNRLVDPSSGRVTIDGAPVDTGPAHALRRRIGYVFQNVGLFPHLNVGENIAIGLRIADAPRSGLPQTPFVSSEVEKRQSSVTPRFLDFARNERAGISTRITELLGLVDLPADIAARAPDALSGGQRQRVGVARALATQPKLLLMDEPFGALDPVTRSDLGKAIRALHDRLGLTTILVTHDMAEPMLLADRVLVMADGAIAADARPADLMAGRAGPAADALVAVPREQAHALAALERGA